MRPVPWWIKSEVVDPALQRRLLIDVEVHGPIGDDQEPASEGFSCQLRVAAPLGGLLKPCQAEGRGGVEVHRSGRGRLLDASAQFLHAAKYLPVLLRPSGSHGLSAEVNQ